MKPNLQKHVVRGILPNKNKKEKEKEPKSKRQERKEKEMVTTFLLSVQVFVVVGQVPHHVVFDGCGAVRGEVVEHGRGAGPKRTKVDCLAATLRRKKERKKRG